MKRIAAAYSCQLCEIAHGTGSMCDVGWESRESRRKAVKFSKIFKGLHVPSEHAIWCTLPFSPQVVISNLALVSVLDPNPDFPQCHPLLHWPEKRSGKSAKKINVRPCGTRGKFLSDDIKSMSTPIGWKTIVNSFLFKAEIENQVRIQLGYKSHICHMNSVSFNVYCHTTFSPLLLMVVRI